MELEHINTEAIAEYKRFFPGCVPSCFQQDLIEQTVTDLKVWREVLVMWAGNAYRPQSVKKMLDCYEEKRGRRFEYDETAPPVVVDTNCRLGHPYCTNTHREELGL